MNEALLNDYLLKYGKQIPKDILDIPNLEDRLHAIEKYIQENLDVKLVSREEMVKNYLENQKPEEVSEESFAKQRLEFIKRLLKFKTSSPILELPDSVDKLVALGLTQDQAYDLMIEVFSKELGIERVVLPKYYEAIRTIDKFVKEGKIDVKLSPEILNILKTRAMPALVAAMRASANIEEQLITAKASAAASASSDLVYQKVEQLIERCTPFIQNQEQSVQEMFTRHSPDSNSNAIFSSILNYGKSKAVGKARDFAVKKFLATEFGKKIATQFATKAATTIATEGAVGTAAVAAAPETFGLSLLLLVVPFLQEVGKNTLSWVKRNFKKVSIAMATVFGFGVGGTAGAIGSFAASALIFNFPQTLSAVGTGASTIFNLLPELVATEIVWPIIAIVMAVPIVIALILFIITNSALVVPYDQNNYSGNPAFSDVAGSCPLESGVISCGSYGTYTPACHDGHGGDHYWTGQSSACLYSIPIGVSCKYNNNHPGSKCYNPSSSCSTYGYAVDVAAPAKTPVYLPVLNDKELEWRFVAQYNMVSGGNDLSGSGNSSLGFGRVYTASDETNNYQIYMGHMESVSGQTTLRSKQLAGNLACIGDACKSSHVHIELQINGINVIPDGLCKK